MNNSLKDINSCISYDLVRLSHQSKTPHLGSNLSAVSILTALYFQVMNIDPNQPAKADRDRFYMSKGHASPSHYMALAHRGFNSVDDVFSLSQQGSIYEEHSGIDAPAGVEVVNGSLGHALGVAAGVALSAQLKNELFQQYVLMGDGELNEGSIWESAMFISANQLSNITAVIDHNKWQATGRSQEIMGLNNIADRFSAFGWEAHEVDGHDLDKLVEVLEAAKVAEKPVAIIAHTIKGKGVSFMEDDNNWHYRIPTEEEVELARQELTPNA